MSVIEMYLKEAKGTKGTWHKAVIANLREYMRNTKEPDIISAINQIKDSTLIPFLWEVGINQTLQDVANKRSMLLAGTSQQGVK